MARNPDIQAKAQAEIDTVVGHSHLPNGTHRPQLPYLEAILSEVLRLSSIAPLGAPHVIRTDDVYKGYFIPKGSMIQPNIW
jgi:cytochrome P450